jgi:hypothetical protein
MKKEPAVPDRRKDDVAEGFVDKVRQHCADNTGNNPSAILQEIAKQETKDYAGDQMEEKKHVFSRGYNFLRNKCLLC